MRCESYFEISQVPEEIKTRMAVVHFSGRASEWYRTMLIHKELPAWPELCAEVVRRFTLGLNVDPAVEFKKVHQTGSIVEYIEKFEKARAIKILTSLNPISSRASLEA